MPQYQNPAFFRDAERTMQYQMGFHFFPQQNHQQIHATFMENPQLIKGARQVLPIMIIILARNPIPQTYMQMQNAEMMQPLLWEHIFSWFQHVFGEGADSTKDQYLYHVKVPFHWEVVICTSVAKQNSFGCNLIFGKCDPTNFCTCAKFDSNCIIRFWLSAKFNFNEL